MEHIEQFLRQLGLHQYVHAFERNGYDSLDILFTPGMDDAEWDRLGPFLNIPRGHILRIRDVVYEEKRKQRAPHLPASSNACTPAEASVGSTRAAREPNSTDPMGVPMVDLTEGPDVSSNEFERWVSNTKMDVLNLLITQPARDIDT